MYRFRSKYAHKRTLAIVGWPESRNFLCTYPWNTHTWFSDRYISLRGKKEMKMKVKAPYCRRIAEAGNVLFSHIHGILTLGSMTVISAELPELTLPLSSILYSQRLRSPASLGPGGPTGPWEPLKPCDPLKPGGPTGPGIFATLLIWNECRLITIASIHKTYVDYK